MATTLTLSAPSRMTATDQAYNAILAAILDGSIPPGAALPLQQLTKQLGMSMMPIREAIRQLAATGIIEVEAHRGARLRPLTDDDLIDTYTTRIVLEGALVEMAARRIDDDVAGRARAALDEQQAALRSGDHARATRAHEDFHFEVYRAAGSDWLLRSVSPPWYNSARYRAAGLADPSEVDSRRGEHELILERCLAHDPRGAYEALKTHLSSTVESFNLEAASRLAATLESTEG